MQLWWSELCASNKSDHRSSLNEGCLTIFCRLWWMHHHCFSGMPEVPFSFGERRSNADKWVILQPQQSLPSHSVRMTLQLVNHIILAWRTGKHSLLEQHYVNLFTVWIGALLFECIINFVSGQFLIMSDQSWLCADIGSEQLLDVIGSTALIEHPLVEFDATKKDY